MQATAGTETSDSSISETSHDHRYPILIIDFPAGSKVRVKAFGGLAVQVWDEVTLFKSLSSSP